MRSGQGGIYIHAARPSRTTVANSHQHSRRSLPGNPSQRRARQIIPDMTVDILDQVSQDTRLTAALRSLHETRTGSEAAFDRFEDLHKPDINRRFGQLDAASRTAGRAEHARPAQPLMHFLEMMLGNIESRRDLFRCNKAVGIARNNLRCVEGKNSGVGYTE